MQAAERKEKREREKNKLYPATRRARTRLWCCEVLELQYVTRRTALARAMAGAFLKHKMLPACVRAHGHGGV